MPSKHENHDAIVRYATERGVINARLQWRQAWELLGDGCDDSDNGWPLVWKVAKELGIDRGCANHNQIWVDPDKLLMPTPPWAREKTVVREPDTDHPVADDYVTPLRQAAIDREKVLGDLRGALEVLPSIVESLDSFTEESLLPYAKRIILATVLLHNTDCKLNDGWESADEAADESEDDDNDNDALWDENTDPTEEAKDEAVAQMMAYERGEEYADGID